MNPSQIESGQKYDLERKYSAAEGQIYLTGIQALVRLPIAQMRRDRADHLNTAALISGYRGSPLGGYDQQIFKAKSHLDPLDIQFQPGVNEELAATAIWGTQQLHLSPGARHDGVLGLWYGKGPGVDRSGDVFKHGNAAGTSPHGGVLCFAGDDHTCKSSSIPHQSDHAFMSAVMPCIYPSSIHEFLEYGLFGIAMSRYSGCWVGMKTISDTVETTAVVDLAGEQRRFVEPEDFEMPAGGLNLRWPDPPVIQDERLQEYKGYAALAFARANRIDEVTLDTRNARFGIVASGKAYEDVRQALREMGIGQAEAEAIGLRLYKVRMTWPLEPEGIRRFSEGLEEVLIVEERREIIEHQIKQHLFNWRHDVRPRIVGKFDEMERPFFSLSRGLTVGSVARGIAARMLKFDFNEGLRARIRQKFEELEAREKLADQLIPDVTRLPHYCAGCPHNISTKVPEGSRAVAGIGCHFMVQWMDRNTDTFSAMGGEGVPWTAISRFTDEKHIFANLGDGTYFHSGILAIRQAVASGASITYKILYNDAVAMTGGQPLDGELTVPQLSHQLLQEGVRPIYLVSDAPEKHRVADLAPGIVVKHRDEMDAVMRILREEPGCSAIIFEQTCAAEKRRRRKRGNLDDPKKRLWINPAVCEGCGDCSDQSNCIAIDPLETEFGRKREINQSACNKDYSCAKGFCPSFVTIEGGDVRKPARKATPDVSHLPEPAPPPLERSWNIAVAGVGGTGVLTIGALLAMAAHIEGKSPMVLDMAGLAQKGGGALSHIRIACADRPVTSPRIATKAADLLIVADTVVAVSKDIFTICDPLRTHAVVNTKLTPVSDFVRNRDFDFKTSRLEKRLKEMVRTNPHLHDFAKTALAITGDEIASNIIMLGFAFQNGLIPVSAKSVELAIEANGVSVQANIDALRWGRIMAHEPERIDELMDKTRTSTPMVELSTPDLIAHRTKHLTEYQNARLAKRYRKCLETIESTLDSHVTDADLRERILRTTAKNYAKLLAYKDEYEVARLYTSDRFKTELDRNFEGDARISFNFAPPLLARDGSDGRPKKQNYSARILPVLSLLAKLKALRGTPFDPFGYTKERKSERALISQYEADLDQMTREIDDGNAKLFLDLLNVPDQIRGYGPVKEKAMQEAAQKRADILSSLNRADTIPESGPSKPVTKAKDLEPAC